MKTKKIAALLLSAVMVGGVSAACFAGCSSIPEDGSTTEDGKTNYVIDFWCSEVAGVTDLFKKQIDAFNAQSDKYVIYASLKGVQEGEAATTVLNDVESAPDMYCFAQDQLARLVQASALAQPTSTAVTTIKENNSASSVAAATSSGKVYCYPLTADNGYFMYYDKSVISESSVGSLESLISDCETAGKKFAFELEGSGWYSASFFFGTGCHSTWTMDENGEFTSVDDDFNSENGIIALRGMQKLLKSECYLNSSAVGSLTAATPAAVLISGTWASSDVKAALGDDMGVAKLPTFTVDETTYQLGSYTGSKLLGVKPQSSTKAAKAVALQELALYLTSEDCQLERYTELGWGPSNTNAQNDDAVKSDAVLTALNEQNVYATTQGSISGSWWDIAKAYASAAAKADLNDTTALQAALDDYQEAIDALFSMTDEEKRAWSVIGNINDTNWNTDFEMVENPTNTWISVDTFDLTTSSELKCRMGASWDVNIGGDGKLGGTNASPEADGTYKIKLVVNVDSDGNVTGGTITFVPQT